MNIFSSVVHPKIRMWIQWVIIGVAPYYCGGAVCPASWRSDFSVIDSAGVAEISGADISLN